MKITLFFIALFLGFNANAGLITTTADDTDYTTGETVLVDFYINEANPEIDWLSIEFGFDSAAFNLIGFSDTLDVFLNSWYPTDAFDFGDTLVMQLGLNSDWSDNLGTSFLWGTAEFIANADTTSPVFSTDYIVAQDFNFSDIDPQVTASVPEPSSFAIMSLLAGFAFVRKRKKS